MVTTVLDSGLIIDSKRRQKLIATVSFNLNILVYLGPARPVGSDSDTDNLTSPMYTAFVCFDD
jgi:hypothetical protein